MFQFFKTLSGVNCCQWDSNYITRRQIFSDKTTFSSCFETTSQSKTIYRKPRLCEQMLDLAISHTKNCYTNQDFFSLAIFFAYPKHWHSDALGWYSISSWDSTIKRGSQKRNQYHGKIFFNCQTFLIFRDTVFLKSYFKLTGTIIGSSTTLFVRTTAFTHQRTVIQSFAILRGSFL